MHCLEAIIARREVLLKLAERFARARIVSLGTGVSMIPMTAELFAEISGGPAAMAQDESTLMYLTERVEKVLSDASIVGPIAYAETEYFGGAGMQAAIAWSRGQRIFEPQQGASGVINGALASIGVHCAGNHDEFDTVGLGRFRSTENV
jgi:hypothetical protein